MLAPCHSTTSYAGRLRRSEWEVRPVPLAIGRDLVQRFHYAAGGSNTATYMHGLFRRGAETCLGVAWWIPPTRTAAQATYPPRWQGVLALSRLVVAPEVPKNAATFLLASSRKMIDRERWPCLVTYADKWRGHTGTIYRSDNWEYVGLTKAERTYVLGGRMVARKAGPRTRTHAEMLAAGAVMVGSFSKHKFRMLPPSPRKSSPPTLAEILADLL
jgi:hypothetical protein